MKSKQSHQGFTLVELLVCIGIISVLLGLLVPVISRARESAQSSVCTSNLRKLANLSQVWSAEHRNFLPLDGDVVIADEFGKPHGLRTGLNDTSGTRYAYTADDGSVGTSTAPSTKEIPTSCVVALIQSASRGAPPHPSTRWSEIESGNQAAKLIRCPSANRQSLWSGNPNEGTNSLILSVAGMSYSSSWYTTSDYATNGGLLGYHYSDLVSHRRYNGNKAKIHNPSHTTLIGDCGSGLGQVWLPVLASLEDTVTLHDVATMSKEIDSATISSRIDYKRHNGKINIAFVDGHVETRKIDNLKDCYLLKGD